MLSELIRRFAQHLSKLQIVLHLELLSLIRIYRGTMCTPLL